MTLLMILAQAAVATAPASAPAASPTLVAPLPTSAASSGQQAVTSYPPAFFAPRNPNSALDMLGYIPGFTLDTGASVRGFEGAAGNVLIDGQRPSSKSDSVDQVLQRITASQVERIDVIRGGAPGIDMQGKTVLANVIRKKTGGVRGLVAVASGVVADDGRVAPSLRAEASGGSNGKTWEVSLRGGRGIDDGSGPGPEVRVDPNGVPLATSQVDSKGSGWQGIATGSFEIPLLGGQFRLNGRYFKNNYDYDETNLFTLPPGLVNIDHTRDDEVDTEIGGRFSRAFGARLTLELVGLRTTADETVGDTFTQRPGNRDDFLLDRYSTETIARAVGKYRQNDRLSWELGVEGAVNDLDSQTRLSENGAPLPIPAANVQVEEKRGEVFAKAVWRPVDKLSIEANLRQEVSRITSRGDVVLGKTLSYTKPRLAVTWSPNTDYQLRLRVEREVGQLNFNDFVARSSFTTDTVTAGNPNLNPEQAWVLEAALERRFWGAGSIVLTGRHFALKDAVDRAPIFQGANVFDGPSNIGSGTKDEIAVELTLPLDRLKLKGGQLKGSLTRRFSEVTDPTTGAKREISNLRPVSWEAHFNQPLPQWNVNYGVDVFGGWRQTFYRIDVIEDQKLKTYVTPYIEWKPRKDIQVHFEIQNVTSRGFRDTRNVYGGPRNLNALAYTDDRDIQFGRIFYLRVRKYFGG